MATIAKTCREMARTGWADETGAVSAEWVVLVAGVIMLGVTVFLSVDGGTMNLADGTSTHLSEQMD